MLTWGAAAWGCRLRKESPHTSALPSPRWHLDGQPRSPPVACPVGSLQGATHQGSCPLSRGQGATHGTHSPSPFRPRCSSGPGPCWAAPRQAGGVGRGGGRPPGAGCGFSPAGSQGSEPQADQAGLGTGSVDVKEKGPPCHGPWAPGFGSTESLPATGADTGVDVAVTPTATCSDPAPVLSGPCNEHAQAGPVPRLESPAATRPTGKSPASSSSQVGGWGGQGGFEGQKEAVGG